MIKKQNYKPNYVYMKVDIGDTNIEEIDLTRVSINMEIPDGIDFWDIECVTSTPVELIVDNAVSERGVTQNSVLNYTKIDALMETHDIDIINHGMLNKLVDVLVGEKDVI